MSQGTNANFNSGLINPGEGSEDSQRSAMFTLIKEERIDEAIAFIGRAHDPAKLVNLVNPDDKRTALFIAAQVKSFQKAVEISKSLLDFGAYVNHCDGYGQTALFFAAAEGNTDLIRLLIERGARLNEEDGFKQTALFYAAREGHLSAVKEMITKGAEVDHLDQIKETPLFYAASKGQKDMCQLLVENGANVNAVDDKKQTAMFFALKSNHIAVVDYLVSVGAIKTKDGRITRIELLKPKS